MVGEGPSASLIKLWLLAGAALLVTVLAQLIRVGGTYVGARIGWSITNRLRSDLARRCLSLDMGFHNSVTPGQIIERVDGDVAVLTPFFSQFLLQVVGSLLLLTGIIAILFVRDLRVGAALTAFALLALLVVYRTRNRAVTWFTTERQARSDLASFVEERVSGLDDIRANGAGRHVVERLAVLNDAVSEAGERATGTALFVSVVAGNGIFALGYGLALSLGVWLYLDGQGSIGTVYLLWQYTAMMRGPLETLGAQAGYLQKVAASLRRINELAHLSPKPDRASVLQWRHDPPEVNVRDVTFAYDSGEPVLKNITFRLPAGATLGVLGRTGSGKTTLVRLLCRLYDPASGQIEFSGLDIRSAPAAALNAQVAMVTQEVQIFHATIRDNLTFFDNTVSDSKLTSVLQAVGLDRWLARQERGLDTQILGSSSLSAGEAQLLALARVFLKDPGLLILDEASARLDTTAEQRIEAALDRLIGGPDESRRTTIIIAHRLETIRRLDKILILENGSVVEFGDRTRLAEDPASRFSALIRSGIEEVLA